MKFMLTFPALRITHHTEIHMPQIATAACAMRSSSRALAFGLQYVYGH